MPQELTFEQIEKLIDKFRVERFTYLILLTCCILIIIGTIIYMLIDDAAKNWAVALGLLAPTGTLSYLLTRIFKIWDDVMNAFFKLNLNQNETDKQTN
ncbi:MAG: hypothetical protein QM535_15995 [Limnohabitans sp.]|nr:hypothetical protein [Limnohabitans sp.]